MVDQSTGHGDLHSIHKQQGEGAQQEKMWVGEKVCAGIQVAAWVFVYNPIK